MYCFSFSLNRTGNNDRVANRQSKSNEFKEKKSFVEVNLLSVLPASIATNDGAATPINVPIKKHPKLTLITGDAILMNQFGRNGVILKKIM